MATTNSQVRWASLHDAQRKRVLKFLRVTAERSADEEHAQAILAAADELESAACANRFRDNLAKELAIPLTHDTAVQRVRDALATNITVEAAAAALSVPRRTFFRLLQRYPECRE